MTTAPAWVPDQAMLGQAVQLLTMSSTPGAHGPEVQKALDAASTNPEFVLYLLFVLATPEVPGSSLFLRQAAGLLAKTCVDRKYVELPPPVAAVCKHLALKALHAPEDEIRNTANNIISTIVRQPLAVEHWPELFPTVKTLLDLEDHRAHVVALALLRNVCEDLGGLMDSDRIGRPFTVLFPLFLRCMGSPETLVRRHALHCTLSCIGDLDDDVPLSLVAKAEEYLAKLSVLTKDPDAGVRKLVCRSLTTIVDRLGEFVAPSMDAIIGFMLHVSAHDTSREVKISATEFWGSVCEAVLDGALAARHKAGADALAPHFPVLIPMLASFCLYSEEELADLPTDDVTDCNVPDRPEDVRPALYKVDGEEEVMQWTLRRCAMAQLDVLATTYMGAILPVLLQFLNTCFSSSADDQWMKREAGIAALGAVGEGCGVPLAAELARLVPFLLLQLQDRRPLIRSGVCWTLSRYGDQLVEQPALFDQVFVALMACLPDRTKKVQLHVCGTISALLALASPKRVTPHLRQLAVSLSDCLALYQARNTLSLYDTLGQLGESMGDALRDDFIASTLMPPLLKRWSLLKDDDEMQLPALMECFTFLLPALGGRIASIAPELFARALNILETVMTFVLAARSVPGEPEPDKVFAVCTLDLIAALYEALNAGMHAIVAPSAPKLLPILQACCEDSANDVRMSAFALVGEMAVHTLPLLQPSLNTILPIVVNNISIEVPTVCNNCCWGFGELALRLGAGIAPLVPSALERMTMILNKAADEIMPRSCLENAAVALSRTAMVCPEAFADLSKFLYNWIRCAVLVSDAQELEQAVAGIAKVSTMHAGKALPFLIALIHLVSGFKAPSDGVREAVATMFAALKACDAAAFVGILQSEAMDAETGAAVQAAYGAVF